MIFDVDGVLTDGRLYYTDSGAEMKAFSTLEQEFEREPSASELAEELDMSLFEVADTLKISGRHLSMDAPFAQGEDNRLLDVIQDERTPLPDHALIKESLSKEVERALGTLTEREAEVIRLYFGLGREHSLTLEEIDSSGEELEDRRLVMTDEASEVSCVDMDEGVNETKATHGDGKRRAPTCARQRTHPWPWRR